MLKSPKLAQFEGAEDGMQRAWGHRFRTTDMAVALWILAEEVERLLRDVERGEEFILGARTAGVRGDLHSGG